MVTFYCDQRHQPYQLRNHIKNIHGPGSSLLVLDTAASNIITNQYNLTIVIAVTTPAAAAVAAAAAAAGGLGRH